MVCIMLIINTDKVNGKNNSSKREKIHSEVLQESKKAVHLYHNNSKKAVVLNQSKMITFKHVNFTPRNKISGNCTNICFCQGDSAPDKENWIECDKTEIADNSCESLYRCAGITYYGWL